MAEINIANDKGRDAVVTAESVTVTNPVRWIDQNGAQAASRKILRATVPHDLDALIKQAGGELEDVAELLVKGDPEVDLELYGAFLEESSRVYIDPDKNIVHKVVLEEIVKTPDGEIKERRAKKSAEPNVSTEIPLKWTGKKFKKPDICRKFVFTGKMQIVHINGLTYDFLFEMAETLEREQCLMLIAGGAKGNQPLLFRRGGLAYRGFLEGRTQGKKYALILHLTNLELKKPEGLVAVPAVPAESPKPEGIQQDGQPGTKEALGESRDAGGGALSTQADGGGGMGTLRQTAPPQAQETAVQPEELAGEPVISEPAAPALKKVRKKPAAKKAPAAKKTTTRKRPQKEDS